MERLDRLGMSDGKGSDSQELYIYCRQKLVGEDTALSFDKVQSSIKSGDCVKSLIIEIINIMNDLKDIQYKQSQKRFMKTFIMSFISNVSWYNAIVEEKRNYFEIIKYDELLIAKEKVKVVQTFLRNGEILQLE